MAAPIVNHRYKLIRKLGMGKFSKVYLAVDLQTGQELAVKAIDKTTITNTNLAPYVLREITTMRRLRHPHIVRLFEVSKTSSHVFLVMEYVPGGDLFHRIKSLRRVPEAAARRYFHQLVSAVAFCHANGVFHRDLKPENIMLDELDNLKVADFGLSALVDGKIYNRAAMLKTTVGTPAYIAPEVLRRQGYDGAKADIWSCGVILYVMIAGRLPFSGTNVYELYRNLITGQFRFPPWFEPELVDLLFGMLNMDPDCRMTIQDIMEHPWFRKDYRPPQFYIEEDGEFYLSGSEDNQDRITVDDEMSETDSGYESDASASSTVSCPANLPSRKGNSLLQHVLSKPKSLNAFDIISGWKEPFLSGVFEEETGVQTRFLSKEPAEKIVSELQAIAESASFRVKTKDSCIILQSTDEGIKGPLTIAAEVSYLTPEIVVLQLRRQAGDQEEYKEFLNNVLKPNLKHLIESPLIKSPKQKIDA